MMMLAVVIVVVVPVVDQLTEALRDVLVLYNQIYTTFHADLLCRLLVAVPLR